ncbi:MAG: (2Fe-2S)-binding protein [Salinivirgaceae bacterium]|nr:(2Fe-2S)-binding protein [Salinivirgaceae bacterium]
MSNIICYCKNITEAEIKTARENGAKTLNDIQVQTKACTGNKCATLNPSGKCCSEDINTLLKNSTTTNNCTCSCCS